MARPVSWWVLPWALWATVETVSVPAGLPPTRASDVLARFARYEECARALAWAESQPDMREVWTVTNEGRYYTTVTYQCRAGRN